MKVKKMKGKSEPCKISKKRNGEIQKMIQQLILEQRLRFLRTVASGCKPSLPTYLTWNPASDVTSDGGSKETGAQAICPRDLSALIL